MSRVLSPVGSRCCPSHSSRTFSFGSVSPGRCEQLSGSLPHLHSIPCCAFSWPCQHTEHNYVNKALFVNNSCSAFPRPEPHSRALLIPPQQLWRCASAQLWDGTRPHNVLSTSPCTAAPPHTLGSFPGKFIFSLLEKKKKILL